MNGLTPLCQYCGKFSELVTGETIYPHRPDLFAKKFFRCTPCDAYVGTHARTGLPLGTLANASLRKLRNKAHQVFDPTWQNWDKHARTAAYSRLARFLEIPVSECHIAMFTELQCQRVIIYYTHQGIYHDSPPHSPNTKENHT